MAKQATAARMIGARRRSPMRTVDIDLCNVGGEQECVVGVIAVVAMMTGVGKRPYQRGDHEHERQRCGKEPPRNAISFKCPHACQITSYLGPI